MAKEYKTYLADKRKRFGNDWMQNMQLKDVNDLMNPKSAERMISDLLYGHYSLGSDDLRDFANDVVCQSVMGLITTRIDEFTILVRGLNSVIKEEPNNPRVQSMWIVINNALILYKTLYNYLTNWYATWDHSWIIKIVTELRPGKAQNSYGNYLSPSKIL